MTKNENTEIVHLYYSQLSKLENRKDMDKQLEYDTTVAPIKPGAIPYAFETASPHDGFLI